MGIYKASSAYLASSILAKLSPFLLLPILTKELSPSDFGTASIYVTGITVAATIIGVGTQAVIPKYFFLKSMDEFRLIFSTLLLIVCLTSILTLTIAMAVSFVWYSTNALNIFVIVSASIAAVLNGLNLSWLRTTEAIKKYLFFEMGLSVCTFLLVFVALKLMSPGVNAWLYPVAASFLIFGILSVVNIYSDIRPPLSVNKDYLSDIFSLCLPLIPHSLSLMIIAVSDRYLLNEMASAQEVAYYVLAVNLAIVVKVTSDAFMKAWNPFFFKNVNNNAMIKKYKIKFFIAITLFSAICFAVIIVFFDLFFPVAYSPAKKLLPILMLSYIVFSYYQINVSRLIHHNNTVVLRSATPVAAALNVSINIFLIPLWGAYAPAISAVLAYLYMAFFAGYKTKGALR